MPGILLYCNGMKPKFKIKLQYDKKNNIWAEFQRHARTRFGKDNFVEETEFDYLEIQVIDED